MNQQHTDIQVTVMFPLASAPFHRTYPETTLVGQVRKDAMKSFGAAEEPTSVFYLSHNGDRLADDQILRDLHEHAHGLKLRLAKELVQG